MKVPVMRSWLFAIAASALLVHAHVGVAEDLPPRYRAVVDKGLEYLAKNQARDGHWEGNGGQYPTTITALCGMTMLMEGSTIREGKYAERIRKAVDWLMDRCQRNGLIGNPSNATEASRYMYGHGYGMLFLAQIYGDEEDGDRRKKLEQILTRAVDFCGKAQTTRGGWGYLTAADGGGFDEGSVTITQVQALRAARNAGIIVPNAAIKDSIKYLQDSTNEHGGIMYSLSFGGGRSEGRPALTAAAITCGCDIGEK